MMQHTDNRTNLREQMRCHKLAMDGTLSTNGIYNHYLALPESEKSKDWKPFNTMHKLLKKYDGLRIYVYIFGR